MSARYYMQVCTREVSVVAGVNRAHLFVDESGRGATLIQPVDKWIHPEKNKLDVLIMQAPFAVAHESTGRVGPFVQVSLLVEDAEIPGSQQVLAECRWPREGIVAHLPVIQSLPFSAPSIPPAGLWDVAERIDALTSEDKSKILEIVEGLREDFISGNVDSAISMSEMHWRDAAAVGGQDIGALLPAIREFYMDFFSAGTLQCVSLNPSNAVFEVVGNDQVVLVSRGLGRPALQFIVGDAGQERRALGLNIYVSRIDGCWRIVR